ncbi:type I-E CRISPR-associated protein Cas7/Cse4/CasC [Limnobaculum xujianqingii]|uniref:type I-E CRISPR-associated protein Cas7/Cse4/CasC n=1 Tax=Limnobaculum xujianqingii TaxID=2738837 RepID=UPI00112D4B32|nr:type I-E CRISPR-associated protein Cas7/Cse4/CasC [Limnobaculum xujianqingii]
MSNCLNSIRIEYHILQSFPVTCLNRDDVGAPKTALVGGVTRARVSSQCWKRQVRLALSELGVKLGTRTKKVAEFIAEACRKMGANEEMALACSEKIAAYLSDDTLLFISADEARCLAEYAKEQAFDVEKIKEKELAKVAKKAITPALDALDIALFGRMVAKTAELNVEAAASFSHAISTHKVSNEVEFFTALDDLEQTQRSAHMGSLEFNAATYYRYISLDIGQLAQTLSTKELQIAVKAFTQALFLAVPSARQTTMSGASPWDFARVFVRKGQRLQVPFESAVKAENGSYLQPSIVAMKSWLDKKEKLSGSLFGKITSFDWGEDDNFSIDDLINKLTNTLTDQRVEMTTQVLQPELG